MKDPTIDVVRIPVASPTLGELEAQAVERTIRDNWISQGPKVQGFEDKIAEAHGKSYGSACNSGTTALHLALVACDVGPGDEVIIPNLTMIALANAVLLTGATPVFADSSETSLVGNVSLQTIKQRITNNTKVVIVVHTYGEPVHDIQEIAQYLQNKCILLIEDCAEAHYSTINGKPVGSFGDFAVFSFYSNKNITTGEGGMVTTNISFIKARIDRLRMHSFTPGKHFCHTEHAFGYRMTDLQASVGLAQHAQADKFIQSRRAGRKLYEELLLGVNGITIPDALPTSVPWVMPLLMKDCINRDDIRQALGNLGIDTRSYFQCMHQQSFLIKYAQKQSYRTSINLAERGLYLPLYPNLTVENITYICDGIKSFV